MEKMTRLSREDWNLLDKLLGKHGWGGYYDLVEVLKNVAGQLGISCVGLDLGDPEEKTDLPQIVQYLSDWAEIISHTPGFMELMEKAAEGTEIVYKDGLVVVRGKRQ